MDIERLLLASRLLRRTLRRIWRRVKRTIKKTAKWVLWGLVLSFVMWLIIAKSGYGPAVGAFIKSIAASVRNIGGF